MQRLLISIIIFLIVFSACSKCSKEEAESQQNKEAVQVEKSEGQNDKNTSITQVSVDAGESLVTPHPNVRFVQTPDGKMVPEAAFRLKIPKMLNPEFLKGVANQQSEGNEQEKGKTAKEENKE